MGFRVGTSGWHYKHWLGNFYPLKLPTPKMLAWYAERFDTVEVNNSFYHLPLETALDDWRRTVGKDFCFAVKGSRFITHMKKLKDPEPALEKFLRRVERLGRKLGPILFQLPPNWGPDLARFEDFLKALPRKHRYAFEFRNPGWFEEPILDALVRHRAALCVYDLAGFQSPIRVTADFAYVRFHGPGGRYQGNYTRRMLSEWAGRMRCWNAKTVYVYFNNDAGGFAVRNALELRQLLD
jgi:uncharacterized protein YecE (DUF72 family)